MRPMSLFLCLLPCLSLIVGCGKSQSKQEAARTKSSPINGEMTPFRFEEKGQIVLKVTETGQILGPRLCDAGSYPYPKPHSGPACDKDPKNLYPMVELKTGAELSYDLGAQALVRTDGMRMKCNDPKLKSGISDILPRVSEMFIGIDETNRSPAACIAAALF